MKNENSGIKTWSSVYDSMDYPTFVAMATRLDRGKGLNSRKIDGTWKLEVVR